MSKAFRSNLHTHSRYSDGSDDLVAYIEEAQRQQFVSLGFSEHAYAAYDPECCIKQEQLPDYRAAVLRLKQQYAADLDLYLGLEYDSYAPVEPQGWDFLIGSVHYLYDAQQDCYHSLDHLPEHFQAAVDALAGGNVWQLLRLYYAQVAEVALKLRPTILGHLDLPTKLNHGNRFFDPQDARYRDLIEETLQAIRQTDCIVEVNTGGMARGYTAAPYPAPFILKRLRALAIPVTLSSDAHCAADLSARFPQALALIRAAGYRSILRLERGAFQEVGLED